MPVVVTRGPVVVRRVACGEEGRHAQRLLAHFTAPEMHLAPSAAPPLLIPSSAFLLRPQLRRMFVRAEKYFWTQSFLV